MMRILTANLCGVSTLAVLTLFASPAPRNFVGGEVVVSRDFGFDPEDSTRFLKAALSSGAAKVIIDRQSSDWVTTSLTGAPNQTVVFESGVTLRAKPGAFQGRTDCLLSYVGSSNVTVSGYGATLRMQRDVYAKPPYSRSEHRHTLNLRSCRDIRVEGLTCTESGGDGIVICGGVRRDGVFHPPANIVLKDVKCLCNYRQGLSVIAVRGLLCENCDFSGTGGTPPQSGVDFEPNHPDEVLQGIMFRDCRFENNKGMGFEFYLGHLNSKSAPVTARFENCVTRGNIYGFEYQQRRLTYNDLPRGGKIELVGCTFERSSQAGVLIQDKPKGSAEITFRDCKLVDCCTVATNGPDVRLVTRLWDTPPIGGVDFGNLEIKQPFERPKFSPPSTDWTAPGVTVPRIGSVDLSRMRVVDSAPGELKELDGVCPAGTADTVFFVESPRAVVIRAQMLKASSRPLVPAKVSLWKDGNRIRKVLLPEIVENLTELSFKVPSPGFYTLKTQAGRHAVRFAAANIPLAVQVSVKPQSFVAARGKAYFFTGANRPFALFAGASSYEKGALRLFAPSGDESWSCISVDKWERFQPAAADIFEGLWCVELVRPKGICHTMYLDLTGTDGFLFLSPERYWR